MQRVLGFTINKVNGYARIKTRQLQPVLSICTLTCTALLPRPRVNAKLAAVALVVVDAVLLRLQHPVEVALYTAVDDERGPPQANLPPGRNVLLRWRVPPKDYDVVARGLGGLRRHPKPQRRAKRQHLHAEAC